MSNVVLIDTSIYLNILNLPNRNQNREEVLNELSTRIERSDELLLPLVTIWEAGKHISRVNNGRHRRHFATVLITDVYKAHTGESPYSALEFPEREEFLKWIRHFPDYAMRSKSPDRDEGLSLVDFSILKAKEKFETLSPHRTIEIWSLDSDFDFD